MKNDITNEHERLAEVDDQELATVDGGDLTLGAAFVIYAGACIGIGIGNAINDFFGVSEEFRIHC